MGYLGNERDVVQDTILKYVQEEQGVYKTAEGLELFLNLGWQYIDRNEALAKRGSESSLFFYDVLRQQLLRLNEFLTDDLADELMRRLEKIPATLEGNLDIWEHLCGKKTVFVPSEKRERNVTFIDPEPQNNVFQVTDEFSFYNGRSRNRYDVVFLINGIPVFFVETKAAHREDALGEALEQVARYHRETPEAMKVLQIYTLTQVIHFFYAATWSFTPKALFNWKVDKETKSFEETVKTFFDKRNVLDLLFNGILFTRKDDELKKVVLRPHQIRAVKKIVHRAEDTTRKRGLIWHTQGSGKTYTMIAAARLILQNPAFSNPTVIMLVDRNELEAQLFGNLKSVGFEIDEDRIAQSKKHLKELLEKDARGLIVSTIQKFEGMPANINTRDNIFVLIDEAHRTTTGDLGNYLMSALPNATYFGFTGTPIDKTAYGKGTFKIFGVDDPKGYLDKYSIAESIEDGSTVEIHYGLAPNELRVDRETLDREFLSLSEAEGVADFDVLNRVLEKAVNLKNMLKSKERVSKVAQAVAEHFTNYVEPMGFKAFLVAVDREACAFYKDELDKLLPPEYSEVIVSSAQNDPPHLQRFHYSEDKEKQIRKAFQKKDELPKILIVTSKLLTGFDAPILYCMYLDKPMRDHTLLQAIARVNRPYEDEEGLVKPCGFILDFVGIFEDLKKALAFDSEDVEDIEKVVREIGQLKGRFSELMERGRQEYLILLKGKQRDKAVESILEYFQDEKTRKDFQVFYKELSSIYEVISPDPFLSPYLQDYETISRMSALLREAFGPLPLVSRGFTKKTAKLVQEHTNSTTPDLSLKIYEIDEHLMDRIKQSKESDTEKVFNIAKSIAKVVNEEAKKNPYLVSIGERAEKIVQAFMEKQKTAQESLKELEEKISEINKAKMEQAEKDMNPAVFTIYWTLHSYGVENAEEVAKAVGEILERHPYWAESKEREKQVRMEMYGVLVSYVEPKVLVEMVDQLMRLLKVGAR